jgi:hypothetical protein
MALAVFGGVLGLALAEQLPGFHFYYSRTSSGTRTYDVYGSAPGDLTSLTRVERPITRWLPLVKFGETVHFRTSWETLESGRVLEHGETTRTHVWALGFCSTAKYDELANQPFEKWQKNPMNSRVAGKRRN